LAPKKIDWDLKRDLEPKLERLQRQTQRKIEHLIRIRLSQQASTLADKESAFSKLAGHLHQNELENVNDDYSDASD
jgi:coiled-coil domain-containing protein 12